MLYSDNYIEVALTATGWDIYTKFFLFIYTLNLHYIPFVWVMVSNWADTRKSQEAGLASIVEWRRNYIDIYSMMIVILLFWIPNPNTTFDASEYVNAIQIKMEKNQLESQEAQSESNIVLNATQQTKQYGSIPIPPGLWFVTMSTKAFTNQMTEWIESLDTPHLKSLLTAFTTMKIKDSQLKAEVNDFYSSCYLPTLYRYQNETKQPLPEPDESDDLNYVGNKLFLNTPGYYLSCSSTQKSTGSCYGTAERMPYDTAEQYGLQTTFILDKPNANGETVQFATSPSCYMWWTGNRDTNGYSMYGEYDRDGLEERLADHAAIQLASQKMLDDVGTGTLSAGLSNIWQWANNTFGEQDAEDVLVQRLLKSDQPNLLAKRDTPSLQNQSIGQDMWDWFQGVFATAGAGAASFTLGIVLELLKPGLLMVQAGIIMTIIMLMAVILPFASFKPGALAALVVYLMGAMLLSLWWAIAGMIDEGLVSLLFPSLSLGDIKNPDEAINTFLFLMSVFFFYLGIPVYFGKMIAVAGFEAFEMTKGEMDGLSSAGSTGAGMASSGVKRLKK